jgi:hypothetical protein
MNYVEYYTFSGLSHAENPFQFFYQLFFWACGKNTRVAAPPQSTQEEIDHPAEMPVVVKTGDPAFQPAFHRQGVGPDDFMAITDLWLKTGLGGPGETTRR